jgi:hypothetical protein
MKKLLVLAAVCLSLCSEVSAQGIQVSYIAPTSGLNYILKRTVGFEAVLPALNGIEEQFNVFLSAGVYFYRPTADTFRTVTITNESGRGPVIPSTQAIKYVIAVPLSRYRGQFLCSRDEYGHQFNLYLHLGQRDLLDDRIYTESRRILLPE